MSIDHTYSSAAPMSLTCNISISSESKKHFSNGLSRSTKAFREKNMLDENDIILASKLVVKSNRTILESGRYSF